MIADEIPTVRGTGENTPFAEQSKDKERDDGHINTMLYPIKVNSNTIELTTHTSCYYI